jgi:hypothetical protein
LASGKIPVTGKLRIGKFQSLEVLSKLPNRNGFRPERPAVESPGQRPGLAYRAEIGSPERAMEQGPSPLQGLTKTLFDVTQADGLGCQPADPSGLRNPGFAATFESTSLENDAA